MKRTVFLDKRKYRQILLHISIWTVFIIFNLLLPQSRYSNFISSRIVIFLLMNVVLFYINYLYLVDRLLLKKKTIAYVSFVIILLLAVTLISKELTSEFDLNHRMRPPSFHKNKVPLINTKLVGTFIFGFSLIITGTALKIYSEWNKNERNKKEIEAQKSATELSFLKNQLNPHFLFNSLNSIYSLTTKKSNDAPEAVITLSELMRYMLYETNNDFVPLNKELEYIQNYLKLQRLRIANNENVTLNIHGTISNQKIRPLLLISFIENAFKYGTDFKGNTEVKIEIYINDNKLQFNCINLIGDRKKDNDSSGIGLKNTKERLEFLYPNMHELVVEEEKDRFIVNLMLKLS
ncbi:sensor histidine kinase [Flavivirga aquimarina]|uniref:Sensor histidine kinase n=1 Tax=Flavivirga aquimarina TaxID=2027862 RepID=A0ABT8W8N9_9FLAO|nr:sensor histidine kinase [Flavivirga aquimarina]MDO5969417.1 sensor histidine kinase [Flavivirga aquimarina]